MFKINDIVKINNTNLVGKIIRIKHTQQDVFYTISLIPNHSNITVSSNQLSLTNTPTFSQNNHLNRGEISIKLQNSDLEFNHEIMLRHQTVEIAIENLERFLSQAICHHAKRVRIIHGRHGGILRNAVHEYLANSPYVESYHLGEYYEGSYGVTIAYLK